MPPANDTQRSDVPRQGDIFLVRFHPGYASELKKFRPAVVIAAGIDERFVLVAPFTTNLQTTKSAVELVIENPGLDAPSLLLTWYLLTIDTTRMLRKLGSLSKREYANVKQALRSVVL